MVACVAIRGVRVIPDYRRYFVPGGTYFFTLVTAGRAPLFQSAEARRILGDTMREKRLEACFATPAVVLLPDHLHVIWTLPTGDEDYPSRWQAIKAKFTSAWLRLGGCEEAVTDGYRGQRRRGVWQPRYFEHTVRDENDSHLVYGGSWSRVASTLAFGGYVKVSNNAANSVSLTFTGRDVSVIGPLGPSGGTATVYLDGVNVGTAGAYAPVASPRQRLFSYEWPTVGTHTLKLVHNPTPGSFTIDAVTFAPK